MSDVKKRGRKKLPEHQTKLASRKNVSLDIEAQTALNKVQDQIERSIGFRPTLTQTVLWLAQRAALGEKE